MLTQMVADRPNLVLSMLKYLSYKKSHILACQRDKTNQLKCTNMTSGQEAAPDYPQSRYDR